MTSWFRSGRPEIIEALTTACERVDEAIQRDLDQAHNELTGVQQERDEAYSRVSQLETENARLKERLRETEAKATRVSTPLSSRTGKEEPDWKAECARVSLKFNALADNFKKAKDALRKRKDERDKWIEHAAYLEKKLKAAEEQGAHSRTARSSLMPEVNAEANPGPNTSFVSDGGLEQADLELPPLAAASINSGPDSGEGPKAANPQSESTQGESDATPSDDLPELSTRDGQDDVRIKEEPSSDQPVVVSERAVRKRKRDEPELSGTPLRKIKLEPSDGSSPLATGHDISDIQESIDLDVVPKMMTPRKRKDMESLRREEQAQAKIFEAATTTPVPLYVRPDQDVETARPLKRISALTPMSVNQRIIRSGGGTPRENKETPRLKRGLSKNISSLAEDGDVYSRESADGQVKKGLKPAAKGRLSSLLNSPSVRNEELLTRSTPRAQARASITGDLPIPGRRELPFEREKRLREKPADQPVGTSSKTGTPGTRLLPQDTRSPLAHKSSKSLLRQKRPSELRADDFKINPLANEGHDFAYTEVVRNKDERACLSGCTDMHCCGKQFRALALSQRPNPPLTPAQRQEEQALLENYLGDFAYRLATMNKEERDELWVEAKTQELANKYGKHRQRYSRMRSPPGFWNADFPDTQELEAEKAEAAKREKQLVQDRYREAMRPGGRWVFRDE